MTEKEFIEELEKIGITPTPLQLEQLEKYYKLIIKWNKITNLTRITEKKEVYLKHFYDSLTINKVINLNNYSTLLDFGTGAGFPGIVLKIFFEDLDITLVDSLNKRVTFLNEVIKELDLKKIIALHSRVEDLEYKHYDIITTRAVANLSKLLNYTESLIDKTTLFISLKSHIDEEIKNANPLLKKYSLRITKREEFYLPYENSLRNIIIINKTEK